MAGSVAASAAGPGRAARTSAAIRASAELPPRMVRIWVKDDLARVLPAS